MSRSTLFRLVACVVPLLIVGCAQQPEVPVRSAEPFRISYTVGPCYGTCPVYQVAVQADGFTYFNGERHTLIEGPRQRKNQTGVFQTVQARLAEWQPAIGVTQATQDCEPRATDLPEYAVIWTNAAGDKAVLEHDTGCRSENARQLTDALKSLDGLLGVDAWVGPAAR
ncbi:DUF6438 domain-containing protein [Halopseudomonas pelagia]|uniref:DUF6438 domain-containing protein n=1 Tax=Halopseudomonas pelagia TaxID=553151 RepID=UPI00039FD2B7|nr:DUF6438 domain-containing protein [Halopseudomonas pelagia]